MEEGYKECPYCGETIPATAKKCDICDEWLEEPSTIEQAPIYDTGTYNYTPSAPSPTTRRSVMPDHTIHQVEELDPKPSKLPAPLALFVRKYMYIVGVIIALSVPILGLLGVFETGSNYWPLYIAVGGLLMAMVGIYLMRLGVGNTGRLTRDYVRPDGEFDLDTPRKYSALAYNWMHRSATFLSKKNALDTFIYKDGGVYVATKDGSEFAAPLSDVTYSYLILADGYKFILTSGDDKIGFFKADGMLEGEEWEDIHNILIRSNFVGETKNSQAIGIGTKILSIVLSLSGSGGGGSSWGDDLKDMAEELGKMKIRGNFTKGKNYFSASA